MAIIYKCFVKLIYIPSISQIIMINVKISNEVNKPLSELWKLSVENFDTMGTWATGVLHSKKGENCDRVCATPFGELHEDILEKNEEEHFIKVAASGMPFFVTKATGGWSFKEITEDLTGFTVELNLETMPVIGSVMGLFMKPKLRKSLEIVANDYKTYLETGEISKSKKREIAKHSKK